MNRTNNHLKYISKFLLQNLFKTHFYYFIKIFLGTELSMFSIEKAMKINFLSMPPLCNIPAMDT